MPNNAIIFDAVRPWLDGQGFTPARISALDAACAAFLADAKPMNAVEAGIAAGGLAGLVTPQGDDKYLPVFQRLASPQARPEIVQGMARAFAANAPRYGQDKTKERIAEFVAQIANETGGFRVFEENLNYSAKRITEVWPSRVANINAAAPLAHNPEALANVVYQRPREGNTQPGDGWRYRGRGALQLTFRNNYRRFGELIGLPLEAQPDLAADPNGSVLIALEFFKQGDVNRYIDAGNFKAARGITNAGNPNFPNPHGLAEVARLRAKALEVLA